MRGHGIEIPCFALVNKLSFIYKGCMSICGISIWNIFLYTGGRGEPYYFQMETENYNLKMKICHKNQDERSQHENWHEKIPSSKLWFPLFPALVHHHRQWPSRKLIEGNFAPGWAQSMLSNFSLMRKIISFSIFGNGKICCSYSWNIKYLLCLST